MGPRKTVLVVDDEPDARRLLAYALGSAYEILEAGDAETALEILRRTRVDLVLLDLHLPPRVEGRSEGLRVHRFLRRAARDTAVIVISGDADPRTRRHLDRLGVDAFLPKPVDAALLTRLVEKRLRDTRRALHTTGREP